MRHPRLSAVLLLFALGCGGGDSPTAPALVATTVTLSASAVSVDAFGGTVQLTATVLDQNGATMSGASVAWTSSTVAVAGVSSTGLVTAVDNGTTTITAASGTASATASVTVAQVPTTLALTPSTLILGGPGATMTVDASVQDAGGSEIAAATLTWTSDDEGIATVDATGLVTAVAAGTTNLTVDGTLGGETASQALPVLVNESLEITTTSLPNGDKNLEYGPENLVATGGGSGGYSWSLAAGVPPTGMSLGTNGALTGTPTVVETSVFTVEVASGDGQTTQRALSITVNAPPVLAPTDLCSASPANAVASFQDTGLEGSVRAALGLAGPDELACSLLPTLTSLTADGVGIASLDGMQNLTGLEYLSLPNNAIVDISALSGLVGLRELRLPGNQITDISAVSGLAGLEVLFLRDNAIVDTSPVSGLANLFELNLQLNGLTSIGPWTGLTSLFYLELYDNAITDLSPLAGLTALGQLGLGFNNISDITPLSSLSYLTQHLGLTGNAITDVTALSGFDALVSLSLEGNGITDISPLSGLTAVTQLNIRNNSIIDVSSLTALTQLEGLTLSDNPNLSDVQPLLDNSGLGSGDLVRLDGTMAPCTAVSTLTGRGATVVSDCVFMLPAEFCSDYTGSAIPDFEDSLLSTAVRDALGLAAQDDLTCGMVGGLTDLDASSVGIGSAVGIQNLTGLNTLNLFDNAISDLSPLSTLTGLTELSAASNGASDLTPLSSLTNLTVLQMGSNGITDIAALAPLTSLTRLVLGVNSISDLTPLAGVTGLAILDIWNNQVSDISTLQGLTGLNFLDLRSNASLSNIQPLINNAGLTTGDSVWLQDVSASLPCADVTTLQGKGVTVTFNVCS